ncbi:MAG: TauD/TfdA family dioxygenase [Sulfuricella sp.]
MKHWNTRYPERFNLDTGEDYKKWREEKLASYPKNVGDLVVELGDMTSLTKGEKSKIMELVELANMCVYTAGAADLSMDSLLALGKQLGVSDTDKARRHSNSDELTNSRILNSAIPFTTRNVRWHTDATYYGSDKTIQALFLLCKRPAVEGGSNKVLDNEILYILLRDKNPDALRVLMNQNCFKYRNPKTGEIAENLGGKVFWANADGNLCHRFSFRKMDMAWSEDADVTAARAALESMIQEESEYVIEGRLESGLGLISNNVLHTREKLVDSDNPERTRLLFRARFYDRVGLQQLTM